MSRWLLGDKMDVNNDIPNYNQHRISKIEGLYPVVEKNDDDGNPHFEIVDPNEKQATLIVYYDDKGEEHQILVDDECNTELLIDLL